MSENNVPELAAEENGAQLDPANETHLPAAQSLTKEEILNKLKTFLSEQELPARAEVDALKQAFYKYKAAENEQQKAAYAEAHEGSAEGFTPEPDPTEEEFKALLNSIKEKRAQKVAQEEKVKEENLEKKLKIIDDIKNITESTDDFGKLYKEFKDLQQAWNEIRQVPQGKEKELWRSYQTYTEKFYDLLKINNELRDYDFKKNLELKTALCESVEKLQEETDVVSAFHQLQNFHQQWREIGPVAKELREELWERFKAASTVINKNYQEHFVGLKELEETNLAEKTAINDALRAIDFETLTSAKVWDEKTKEVIDLQAKWKTIGFVPRKVNTKIFEEFRALCDTFFEKKAEYFKDQREGMDQNLEKKRELVEKAKELKDSEDWKATTDKLIALQKEWKLVGPVPRKYSDALWKEFIEACDYFFEQKKKTFSSQKEEETANLELKKALIEKIKALDTSLSADELMPQLREFMGEWNSIGFVPFKEKDKIYKEYQTALDEHFDRMKIDKAERRLQSFRNSLDGITKSDKPKNALYRERERLIHQYNKVKSDLQTYENNMGFLSVSKGSGGLLKDMNHRIEGLKGELDIISKKIEAIDESMNAAE